MKALLAILGYFGHPFPSQKGFSPYRMPGALVHGPLIFASALVGLQLCGPHPALRPLLLVWLIAGVYLGRDIAIRCHYFPLLTLICWVVSGFIFFKPGPMAKFGAAHETASAVISIGVGVVQIAVVSFFAWSAAREAPKNTVPSDPSS